MSRSEFDFDERREEAARRVARAHLIGVSPENDVTIAAWRREDPANDAMFHVVHGVWDKAESLPDNPSFDQLLGRPTLREHWVAWRTRMTNSIGSFGNPYRLVSTALIALVAIVGAGLWTRSAQPDYATAIAEVKELPLEDGSIVTLGAKSEMNVAFNQVERRVRLASGEAFFSIAKDSSKPFIVEAGDTLIRVTGTKFNVNYEGDRIRVSVLEGRVLVIRRGEKQTVDADPEARSPIILTAGQQVVDVESLSAPKKESAKISDVGAWRDGRLSYQDASLGEVVADVNRYRAGEIRFASAALAQARVTTSFKVSQIDQMIDMLPDIAPVTVVRNADGTVALQPVGNAR